MSVDAHIRREIEEAMRRKGWTQSELARRLGVKPQSIYPILKGTRGKQPRSLVAILDALDLELEVRPKRTPSPAWQSLAGRFTDPDAPDDMSLNHDTYIDEEIAEAYMKSVADDT